MGCIGGVLWLAVRYLIGTMGWHEQTCCDDTPGSGMPIEQLVVISYQGVSPEELQSPDITIGAAGGYLPLIN